MWVLCLSQVLRIENGQEIDLSCISGLPSTAHGAQQPLGGVQRTAGHLPHGPAGLTLEVCSDEVHFQLTTGTAVRPPLRIALLESPQAILQRSACHVCG